MCAYCYTTEFSTIIKIIVKVKDTKAVKIFSLTGWFYTNIKEYENNASVKITTAYSAFFWTIKI